MILSRNTGHKMNKKILLVIATIFCYKYLDITALSDYW